MGIPTSIKTLLSGRVVEWARIEFKETWDPEASLKTICAFANDIDNWGGGYLVIGVRDDQGKPDSLPGVPKEKIDGYLKDMLNKCKRIQPEYMPITEVAEYQEKFFIVVWAPGGSNRPYSSPRNMARDCKERIYWIRKMASTIVPTEEQKKDLYDLANKVPFDDRVNHHRRIGEFPKELHLTEGRNTGFQKIIRALKANGSPMPIFETDEDRTYFLTTILVHPEFTASNEAVNEAVSEGMTHNEQSVLNAMKLDATVTTLKMAELLGLSRATIQRTIRSLKEKGIIRREGAAKNGKWTILK